MNNSVRIVHPVLVDCRTGSSFKRCRGDKLRWLDPEVASVGARRWAVAGRRQARVRDGQARVREGQDREQVGQEDGHKHEFGGSGARFRRLRRRRGVPGDALVQMTIKTGAYDARG